MAMLFRILRLMTFQLKWSEASQPKLSEPERFVLQDYQKRVDADIGRQDPGVRLVISNRANALLSVHAV